MSGMYRGSFNPQVVDQDFSLRLDKDSLVGRTYKSKISAMSDEEFENLCAITGNNGLNTFNLSSVGCALLNKLLRTTSLNEERVKVKDADLWIPTYRPLFDRLRWRRPGPSLIKPWAGILRNKQESKRASEAYKKLLAIKIELMKKNYVPEFTKPYLPDLKNLNANGEVLRSSWEDDGPKPPWYWDSLRILPPVKDGKRHKKRGLALWNRSRLIKLMRYNNAVNNEISLLLEGGIPESCLNKQFYSEHDRFWGLHNPDFTYVLRRYGAQRSWYQMKWQSRLRVHDRIGMVLKPKNANWISWRRKRG